LDYLCGDVLEEEDEDVSEGSFDDSVAEEIHGDSHSDLVLPECTHNEFHESLSPLDPTCCSICCNECEMIPVSSCSHLFCKDCIIDYIHFKIDDFSNLRHQQCRVKYRDNVCSLLPYVAVGIICPHRGCTSIISDEFIRSVGDPSDMERYDNNLLLQTISQELAKQLTRCNLGCGSYLQENCYCIHEDCRRIQKN